MANTIADIAEKKIISGILAIKNGTKTPMESKVNYFIEKLSEYNEALAQDFQAKYVQAVKVYNEA
jgi:hypothetical protein